MSVTITVAGTDRTTKIDWKSFTLQRALTNQADTVQFLVRRKDVADWKPSLLDDIQVVEDGVTLFGGNIITIDEKVEGLLETVSVTCKDYSFDLDRLLVVDVYQAVTVRAAIKEIIGVGNALNFQGTDDYIVSGSSVAMNGITFSITGRFKRSVAGTLQYFLSQGSAALNNGLELGFQADNTFIFSFYSTNKLATTATYTVDNLWHSFVCTYNATTNARKIYIDNVLVASDTAPADYGGTGVLTLGRGIGPANYYTGYLDEVVCRNIELSATQVTTHFNRGAGLIETADSTYLIGYHLDETSGTTAVDFVGSNNATLNGGMGTSNWVEGNCSTRGFTINNVVGTNTINYLAFNYEQPSKCFQQLAELFECDWFVDYQRDIHFGPKLATSAPFNLTDTNGYYFYNSLVIRKDIKNLRNSVIVRGGKYQGTTVTETQNADGVQITFTLAYQYSSITVTVAGVAKTVGIDFIDDPTLFDCLYNFNEKSLKFPTASKPTAGQAVAITGLPYIPVIVNVKEAVSLSNYGEYQFKIIDKSLNSKEGARDRAKAEISAWATSVNEGSFSTITTGLDTGQTINIQSTNRSIDQDYVISRITSKLYTPTSFKHDVTLVTTNTFGMVEFLQKLLMDKDKEITINANEVTDEVTAVDEPIVITESTIVSLVHNTQNETATIGEVATVQALNYAVQFCVGDQVVTGAKRPFITNGSPLA